MSNAVNRHLCLQDDRTLTFGELESSGKDHRIMSICIDKGSVCFSELCDETFNVLMSPEESVVVLEDMIKFITQNTGDFNV